MKKLLSLAILLSLGMSYTVPVFAADKTVLSAGAEQTVDKKKKKSQNEDIKEPLEEILNILSNSESIIQRDNTKMLSKEIIMQAYERSKQNFLNSQIDYVDIYK